MSNARQARLLVEGRKEFRETRKKCLDHLKIDWTTILAPGIWGRSDLASAAAAAAYDILEKKTKLWKE